MIENLNSGITACSKNVKRWQGGSMVLRWVSAGVVEAGKKFRRVQGWRDIEKLVRALNVIEAKEGATAERVAQHPPRSRRLEKINSERDNPSSSRRRGSVLLLHGGAVFLTLSASALKRRPEFGCGARNFDDEERSPRVLPGDPGELRGDFEVLGHPECGWKQATQAILESRCRSDSTAVGLLRQAHSGPTSWVGERVS